MSALTAAAGPSNGTVLSNAQAGPSDPARATRATRSRPASPPGGGPAPLIQLRSKAPLPVFTCSHPIPPASSTIGATLKLSVLRLLTGEMTERSSTAPMTESESLKLMTLHGWRMEMIALELRQNVLIAPETRDRIGDGVDDQMQGFELGDDAECALLEPDDEVLIRLKPSFHLPDLHLPKLASDHVYALPRGALTRAGTLSSPPPYSQLNIKKAAEPSSHSSSVQGQPNVNYHARHRDYTRGYRSITVQQGQSQPVHPTQYFGQTPAEARKASKSSNPALNGPSKPLGLGMGVEPPAAQPATAAYRASGAPKARRTTSSNSKQQAQVQPSQPSQTASTAPQPPSTLASPIILSSPKVAPSPPLPQLPEGDTMPTTASPLSQPPPLVERKVSGLASATPSHPPSTERKVSGVASTTTASPPPPPPTAPSQQQSYGSGQPAGQDAMPLTALVIGPGVQGAVGRGSKAAMGHSGQGEATDGNSSYGNAKAFASFTAAGGEVRHRDKQRSTSHGSHDTSNMGQQRKDIRSHGRSASQQDILSAAQSSSAQRLGPGVEEQPQAASMTPAQAAVDAAQRRATAARAAQQQQASSEPLSGASVVDVAERESGSGAKAGRSAKTKKERVQLPALPTLSPIANLAPFPSDDFGAAAVKESDLPAMPTPADSPDVVVYTPRQMMKRTQSSAAQSRQSGTSGGGGGGGAAAASSSPSHATRSSSPENTNARPANDRQVSSRTAASQTPSSTNASQTNGGAAGEKKLMSRFARLAAPGLGLGLAPPLSGRRQNSHGSVDPASGNDGASSSAAGWARTEPVASPAAQTPDWEATEEDVALDADAPCGSGTTGTTAAPPPRKLTKAERRYAEFQKQVASEVQKQSQAEEQRTAEKESRRREEEKKLRKREAAAKEKKEREKWEIWREVRKRTDEDKGV